jgi:protein gp37
MSNGSKIEWTDATWNPVTGCTKVSDGCDNCYADTFAERWRGVPGHHFEQGFDVQLRPERLRVPLSWQKPRKIFVDSMFDLFHKDIPDWYIAEVFAVMAVARRHIFQIPTKRHGRMRSLLSSARFADLFAAAHINLTATLPARHRAVAGPCPGLPLENVWLGVSAENQPWWDIRVPVLLRTPAAVRFVSAEPLLGPITMIGGGTVMRRVDAIPDPPEDEYGEPECQDHGCVRCGRCSFLDWVIVGGESGHHARPMEIGWAQAIVGQCQASGVPVFMKQLGRELGRELGAGAKGGDWDRWPADLRVRQFPAQAALLAAA